MPSLSTCHTVLRPLEKLLQEFLKTEAWHREILANRLAIHCEKHSRLPVSRTSQPCIQPPSIDVIGSATPGKTTVAHVAAATEFRRVPVSDEMAWNENVGQGIAIWRASWPYYTDSPTRSPNRAPWAV